MAARADVPPPHAISRTAAAPGRPRTPRRTCEFCRLHRKKPAILAWGRGRLGVELGAEQRRPLLFFFLFCSGHVTLALL